MIQRDIEGAEDCESGVQVEVDAAINSRDSHPANFEEIIGVGFELWTVSSDLGLRNLYIGDGDAALTE
jgi:hypothetical protein